MKKEGRLTKTATIAIQILMWIWILQSNLYAQEIFERFLPDGPVGDNPYVYAQVVASIADDSELSILNASTYNADILLRLVDQGGDLIGSYEFSMSSFSLNTSLLWKYFPGVELQSAYLIIYSTKFFFAAFGYQQMEAIEFGRDTNERQ